MKSLLAIMVLTIFASCNEQRAQGDEELTIACRYAKAWDFVRCENEEVICYHNKVGLSCTWKE